MANRNCRTAALATLLTLSAAGCTPGVVIENMNVQTVAVGCDVERGSDDAGNFDGGFAQQQGAANVAWASQLHSRVNCPDGTAVEASTLGESTKAEQLSENVDPFCLEYPGAVGCPGDAGPQ